MYDNIGRKIKVLARTIFVILTVLTVIAGIIYFFIANKSGNEFFYFIGILYIILGPVCAWASTLTLCGFGEIIDKLTDIEYNTRKENTKSRSDMIQEIEDSYKNGVISEDSYNNLMNQLR